MKTPLHLILALLGFVAHAAAWDDLGHMMVGAIAYDRLTPDVRQKVITLLKLNPHYARCLADAPEDQKAPVAFLRSTLRGMKGAESPFRNAKGNR
jgi:hypothetical protein